MLSPHCIRACGLFLVLSLMVFWVGCGPNYQARGNIKGKVTFEGKTLTAGNVMFYGKDNLTGSSPIDMNGNYDIKDAPLGDVKITVTVPKMPSGGISKMKGGPAMTAIKDAKSVDPEGSGKSISIMGAMPSHIVPIPDKYANVATSGLTHKVERGEHVHDLNLTP